MKKTHLRRTLAAVLSGIMLASTPVSALSYTGLGEVIKIKRDTVGDGLYYSKLNTETESGKSQQAYILEYAPDGNTLPLVRWGSSIYGKDRVGSLVVAAANEGETMFAAINGDFYSPQTGVPLGIMIDGGKLISSDDGKYAMGFTADQKAIIGKPSIGISVTNNTAEAPALMINHVNKYPTVWGIYMLTEEFASTTKSASEALEVVIELDGELAPSSSVTGRVVDIINDSMDNAIPEGCAIITVFKDSSRYGELAEYFNIGDEVTINVTCAEGWESVTTAIGGGDLILYEGVMPEGIIDEDHEKKPQPRTAAGIKADGTTVFFAVDGRSTSSYGLTEAELSAVMAELGCVAALNLDGGGSTTVMVKASDEENCLYVNLPSDGSHRTVSNGILFVSANQPDGVAARLSVYPNTPYILAGSTVDFTARALDSAYTPLDLYLTSDMLTASFREEYTDDAGSVSGGSYTAGSKAGEYKLSLSNGSISGDVSVMVVDELHKFEVFPEYIKIKPGTYVELDVDAVYNGMDIHFTPSAFNYTLNGTQIVPDQEDYPGAMLLCDLGYLDTKGNFQSFGGEREGVVEIEISFGGFVRRTTINIGTTPDSITNFETMSDFGKVKLNTSGSGLYLAIAEGRRTGNALEFGFSHDAASPRELASAKLREPISVSKDAESIKLFVKGDTSGVLTAKVMDEDGNEYSLSYTVTKDYSKQTGWRELTAEIPASLRTGNMLLTDIFTVTDAGENSRTIIIDDAVIHLGEDAKTRLTGIEEHWAEASIRTLYDMGVILDNDCEESGELLSYSPDEALTRGEFAKMVTLFNGIMNSEYSTDGIKLEDSTPEDKIPYILAAIDSGLMSGRGKNDDGTVIFDSEATITRQEAFKVIGSLITSDEAELTFDDNDNIAEWARSGVAKCVGAGIVGGYSDNTIKPTSTITRAELATILFRMA